MNRSAIAVQSLDEIQTFSSIAVRSGLFKDLKEEAQAVVKIMAGAEMGIGAVAALRGIDLVDGQMTFRAHLMAAMLKKSGKYDYRIRESTDERCAIEFFQQQESLGTHSFTMEQAKKAGLFERRNRQGQVTRGPWQLYPEDMLYNRTMAKGARMFCPDIFIGAVYDQDELGHLMDDEPVEPHPAPGAEAQDLQPLPPPSEPATDKQCAYMLGLFKQCGVPDGYKRRLFELVYNGQPGKAALKQDIEHLQIEQTLPDLHISSLIILLREDYGIDKQTLIDYCQSEFGQPTPFQLSAVEQVQLIDFLVSQSQPETDLTPVSTTEAYQAMFPFLANQLGTETAIIEAWFSSHLADSSEAEMKTWMTSLNLQDLQTSVDEFVKSHPA